MSGWGRGGRDHLDLGDWNASCSMCGRKRKASEMVRNWQGQFRCPEHNEARHPQEYVRPVPDVQTPPWVQPPCDEFAGVCFPDDITGIADYAVADCAICEYVSPVFSGTLRPPQGNITILPDYLPDGQENVAYSQQMSATGGSGMYLWSAFAALPVGFSFSSDGLLSGTSASFGVFLVPISVQDLVYGNTTSLHFILTIIP